MKFIYLLAKRFAYFEIIYITKETSYIGNYNKIIVAFFPKCTMSMLVITNYNILTKTD